MDNFLVSHTFYVRNNVNLTAFMCVNKIFKKCVKGLFKRGKAFDFLRLPKPFIHHLNFAREIHHHLNLHVKFAQLAREIHSSSQFTHVKPPKFSSRTHVIHSPEQPGCCISSKGIWEISSSPNSNREPGTRSLDLFRFNSCSGILVSFTSRRTDSSQICEPATSVGQWVSMC